jgi:uncharacterized membrane protein YphA (DoxX/SURF4 family)
VLLDGAKRGEPAVLFSFIFLFFAAHGPGDWSIDAVIRKARAQRLTTKRLSK